MERITFIDQLLAKPMAHVTINVIIICVGLPYVSPWFSPYIIVMESALKDVT